MQDLFSKIPPGEFLLLRFGIATDSLECVKPAGGHADRLEHSVGGLRTADHRQNPHEERLVRRHTRQETGRDARDNGERDREPALHVGTPVIVLAEVDDIRKDHDQDDRGDLNSHRIQLLHLLLVVE